LVGTDALTFAAREHVLVSRLAELFRVRPEEVGDRVEQAVSALRDAEKEIERLRSQLALANVGALAAAASDVNGVALVAMEAPAGTGGNEVRTLAQEVRNRLVGRPAVVAVASRSGGKATLVVATNPGARERGLSAGDLVKGALSGRGGGSPELAQGGGVPEDQVPALLAAVEAALR
jgi:alanyl-tRNA synthetase